MNTFITQLYRFLCALSLLFLVNNAIAQERRVVLQAFWWDYWHNNYQANWSNYLTELAPRLKSMGIDAVWIPPSIKNGFTHGVGYAPFDHYDLGDKFQKGDVKTRLGTKDDLLRMIAVFHANGIDVIQDIVPNHIIGAGSDNGGGGQDPAAWADQWKNFRYTSWLSPATNQTLADYSARTGRFHKNWQNFHPNPDNNCTTGDICQQMFGPDISYSDNSHGASGNLAEPVTQASGGANNGYMRKGMREWLIWYKKQTGFDGVRLDAVKHYDYRAGEDFLFNLQNSAGWASGGSTMYAVGEFVGSGSQLDTWADAAPTGVNTGGMNGRSGTFDFGLRGWSDGLAGITFQGGGINLGTVINGQQSSRGRTVPFVNNHDTFRPILSANGNFSKPLGDNSGWRTGDELAPHVDPRDPRLSVSYAVMMAVDGSPQIFIEDLFDLGTEGNRYTHDPKNPASLKVRSDLENLIWCRQNLNFFDAGANYVVRWQAADALVIERTGRALVATNDNWNTWQNLTGVQTAFADGTQLKDYSGANGIAVRTVYGGGKVDISIPPCDGTALQGRRGYAVWAPVGQDGDTYSPSRKAPAAGLTTTTQEWEMANDLGDSHCSSLGQGGALPASSTVSRLVGKIYVQAGTNIVLDLFIPINTNLVIASIHNLDGTQLFSRVNTSGSNTIGATFTAPFTGWYALKVRQGNSTQPSQNVFLKATYTAPTTITDAMLTTATNTTAIWTGAFSNDWTECRNWEQGIMPAPNRDILVPGSNNTNILNVNGALQARNIIIETLGGSINITATGSVTANGDIILGGNITNAGTLTATGNLIVSGLNTQTISGAGNVNILGNTTVNKVAGTWNVNVSNNFVTAGNFTQTSGNVTLNNATQNFIIGGNFSKTSGIFTHTAGIVIFNGSNGLQTISSNTLLSFFNVDINKTTGATREVQLVNTDLQITGAGGGFLSVLAGKLDLNGQSIALTGLDEDLVNNHVVTDRSSSTSGQISFGTVTVNDASNIAISIHGSGISLQNGFENSANIIVIRRHHLVAGSMLRRHYSIQVASGTFSNGSMRISYAAEDLAGIGVTEASMKLQKYVAPSTFTDVGGVMNVPAKQITQTGGLGITGTENFAVGLSTSDVSVTAAQANITENAGTTTFVFSRGTGTTGDLTVNFTYAGSAALTTNYTVSGAASYTGGNGTIVIPNGQSTANLTITAVNDQIQNADRNITVNLAAGTYVIGTPNNAALTLTNDDIAGATFSKVALNTTRYGGADTYTYRLNSQPTANVTINLASSDIVGGGTVAPATLTFTTANWATPQNVTVTGANGGSGTVAYNITSTATSADAFYNGLGIANMPATNIDQVPIITITAGTAAGEPATNGSFNIALSVARSVPTVVNITVSGTATGGGTDYTLAAGTNTSAVSTTQFTFAANQTSGTLAVNVVNDALTESREFAIVTLAAGTGYTVGVANQATLTVNDDESLTLLDGVISPGEYGDHSNGQNAALLQGNTGQDWYMTWDNNNLYVGLTTANLAEGLVLYIAKNPSNPINGGTNADGTNIGFNYDNTNFAELPFRADIVMYVKNNYREFRTTNGSNGWSAQTAAFGSYGDNATGNVREFILPWSAIGGRPTSMAFFGHVAYPGGGGGIYGQTPSENAGGGIGLNARNEFYHSVPDLTTDKPFARKSYVYNSASSKTLNLPAYITNNNLVVHDFTMNTASQTLTRATAGSWTVNGTMNLLNGTVDFSTSGLGTNINAFNISSASATLNCNAVTAPITITNYTQSNGTVSLSSEAGSSLRVLGNWNKSGGTFTANSRIVSFEGNTLQTITDNGTAFAGITINNPNNVNFANNIAASGVVTVQSGKLNLNGFTLNLGTTGSLAENRANNHLVIGTGSITAANRGFNTTSIATDIAGLGIGLQDATSTQTGLSITRTHSNINGTTAKKNFLLTGVTPNNAELRIFYATEELSGIGEPNTQIATVNGMVATTRASTRDIPNRFVTTTGITAFTTDTWTIGTGFILTATTPALGTGIGVDATITLTGTGFTGTTAVSIGGQPARSFCVVNATTIKAVTNDNITNGDIVITNGGTATLNGFVAAIVPNGTITGTNFVTAGGFTVLRVNITPASPTQWRQALRYREVGATTWNNLTIDPTLTSVDIQGVTANKAYEIYLQTISTAGQWSNRSAITTSANSGTATFCSPTVATTAGISGTMVTFNWTAQTNATRYIVRYWEVAPPQGTCAAEQVAGSNKTVYVDNGAAANVVVGSLKPNTNYAYDVQVYCGSTVLTNRSNVITFTTGAGIACAAPSTVNFVQTTLDGYAALNVTWSGATGVTTGSPKYQLRYKTTAGTSWSYWNTDATNYTMTGLEPSTQYDFQIAVFCNGGGAEWSSLYTPMTGAAPNSCPLVSLGASSPFSQVGGIVGANLVWTGIAPTAGRRFFLGYTKSGESFTVWRWIDTNGVTVRSDLDYPNLMPSSTYSYDLQVYCNTWNFAGYAIGSPVTFTTGATTTADKGIDNLAQEQGITTTLVVYPNPSEGEVNIAYQSGKQVIIGLTILDVLGRTVYSQDFNGSISVKLDGKTLSSGVYVAKVTENGKVMTKRFVIQ